MYMSSEVKEGGICARTMANTPFFINTNENSDKRKLEAEDEKDNGPDEKHQKKDHPNGVKLEVNPELEPVKWRRREQCTYLDSIERRMHDYSCIQEIRGHTLVDSTSAYKSSTRHVANPMHQNSFIAAALQAWQEHGSLSIAPQHIWLLLLQGLSAHVNQNPEASSGTELWNSMAKKQLSVSFLDLCGWRSK